METPLSVFMTAGDLPRWRSMEEGDRRLLLGRRLAQLCFKLEMWMPAAIGLRVLPAVVGPLFLGGNNKASGEGAIEGAGANARAGGGAVGGEGGPIALFRALPLLKFSFLVCAYMQLLVVKNTQLEDDVHVLRGLKIGKMDCAWVEQVLDSLAFGRLLSLPWWTGLVACMVVMLSPSSSTGREIMSSEHKLRTLGMKILNFVIGRTPGGEDEEEEEDDDDSEGVIDEGEEGQQTVPPGKLSSMAKVAAVASGLLDS
ncbi:unnamed protein product [Choristocarpus tenellus]